MIFVAIRLVGDEKDRLFKHIKLDPQIHLDDLLKLVEDTTHIPPQFQEITFRGQDLPDSLHPLGTIKNFEEIEVKHTLLQNWSTYLEQIELIRRMTTSGATSRKKAIALRGRTQLSPLDDSKFFVVYPGLVGKREQIDGEINFLVHNTKKYMRRALNAYFGLRFDGKLLEIVEKPKQTEGVQLGYFVFVKDNVERPGNSYYAKTVGSMPKIEFAPELKPNIDLTELFVYQLLKLIGMGPSEVHIIPDGLRSECVYLATKLIENFFTASGKSVDHVLGRVPSTEKKQIMMNEEINKELNILVALLGLEDLMENKGNYGFIERKLTDEEKKGGMEGVVQELRIVDFRVNVNRGSRISKSKNDIPYLERYFKKWDMMSNIEKAKELVEEDKAIKGNGNTNKEVFDDYVKRLKKTLQDFINNPRKSEAS